MCADGTTTASSVMQCRKGSKRSVGGVVTALFTVLEEWSLAPASAR